MRNKLFLSYTQKCKSGIIITAFDTFIHLPNLKNKFSVFEFLTFSLECCVCLLISLIG